MNSKKRNLSNRDEENEPSTSADCGSERSQRKKKCIPGSYLYQFNDDELSDEAGGDFSDSGSEWEASRSGIASYIDGGSKSDETVNSLKNSATISIPDARIAENSIGDINLERTVDNLSALANNTDSKISNNEKTVSKDANITKHVWTLNEIRAKDRAGQLFTVARQTTVRHSGKVTSLVWQSFEVVGVKLDGNEILTNFVKCKKCSEFVQFNKSTTTQLSRHKCNSSVQLKIDKCLTNGPKVTVSKEDKMIIRDAAAQFVALDVRPFVAVEGEGMKTLLLTVIKIAKKYHLMTNKDFDGLLPHRLTVARHIADKAQQAKAMMIDNFKRALEFPGGFTCTTYLYTDCYKNNNYLGITASLNLLENGKIKRKQYIVNLNKLDAVEKKGVNIWIEIKKCLESFHLTEKQIIEQITWVTDRGGNLKNSLEKCRRLNCYAHIINNIVKHMCDKEPEMKKIISKSSSLVRYMKLASVDTSKLKSSLKSYCETRWNTVFFMLQSIILNFPEIYQILSERERSSSNHRNVSEKLTCLSKQTLESVCGFLELFKDISIQIEGDQYETIHRVWPAYVKMLSHLQENDADCPIVKNMKELGRKYMADNIIDVQPANEHKIAVFLHPLLKKLNYADELQRENIITHVKSLLPGLNNDAQMDMNGIQNVPTTSNSNTRTARLHLFEDFLMTDISDLTNSGDEVQKYINFQVEMTGTFDAFNLFQWWEQHQTIFPKLFKLFMRTYTTAASSASSERGFSVTGRTLDSLRSSLKPSTVNSIMLSREFYRHNRENEK